MKDFITVITALIDTFTKLEAVSQLKLDAAANNQVTVLEECITKEQALSMQLRGLEQKREKVQAEMGFSGQSFHQILEAVDETQRQELLPLFDALSRAIQMFQSLQENLNVVVGLRLRQIKKEMERKEGTLDAQLLTPKDGKTDYRV